MDVETAKKEAEIAKYEAEKSKYESEAEYIRSKSSLVKHLCWILCLLFIIPTSISVSLLFYGNNRAISWKYVDLQLGVLAFLLAIIGMILYTIVRITKED